jgi:hypothetical protein
MTKITPDRRAGRARQPRTGRTSGTSRRRSLSCSRAIGPWLELIAVELAGATVAQCLFGSLSGGTGRPTTSRSNSSALAFVIFGIGMMLHRAAADDVEREQQPCVASVRMPRQPKAPGMVGMAHGAESSPKWNVHCSVDPHLGPRADGGAIEHARTCGKERAVAYGAA